MYGSQLEKLEPSDIFDWACFHINCTNSAKELTHQLRWAKNQRGNSVIDIRLKNGWHIHSYATNNLKTILSKAATKNSPKTYDTPVANLQYTISCRQLELVT